ncbi:MAG: HAEPLYID family protein, partial [Bacteroidia bacterium]
MKRLKTCFSVVAIFVFTNNSIAQTKPDKVSHAEPLFFDLVRDLGARSGEKEINVGVDFANITNYNKHAFLVEYEFAPINRVGFEVEAEFSFFKRTNPVSDIPNHKLECL